MKKILKKSMLALMVVLFSATLAMAADQTQTKDQKHDSSCQETILDSI